MLARVLALIASFTHPAAAPLAGPTPVVVIDESVTPRVEIGDAVLRIYDERGVVVAIQ